MIPIYINVRNRLTTTRILAEQVSRLPDAMPILIDNASDWEPLLEWYRDCPFEVLRLRENAGHHAPWAWAIPGPEDFQRRWGGNRYVVTDCDIDIGDCPLDLLDVLDEPFEWHKLLVKSGLSLRIDDLPEWQQDVRRWESRWWQRPVFDGRYFQALVDTTFCMFDATVSHSRAMQVVGIPSLRSAPPYTARHMPWYIDGDNLDDENRHYFATSNNSNSWKLKGRGLAAGYAS
jgi:hypothetical protein